MNNGDLMSRIGAELGGKRNGSGLMVQCPAHDDRNPSLSVDEGQDGRLLVRCFAGCGQDSVIDALKSRGLWIGAGATPRSKPIRLVERIPTSSAPAQDLALPPPGTPKPDMGGASMSWEYRDQKGATLFYIARMDAIDGKQFVPYSWDRTAGAWVKKAWPAPRPLYGLAELALNPTASVMVVEGEKAADAARAIVGPRYVVVTWPNGAKAVEKVDWTPLHGRKVLIWPDADLPGIEAARIIGAILAPHCETGLIEFDPAAPDAFTSNLGFDAADALALGWDWAAFSGWAKPKIKKIESAVTAPSAPAVPTQAGSAFESVSDSFAAAKDARARASGKKCPTGIRPLDKALGGGFGVGDVGLIVGPPGSGKTELGLQVALHNAALGKRVAFFALEAERYELTQRLLFRELADRYFADKEYRRGMLGKKLSYSDWFDGQYGDALADLEQAAEEAVREKYKTLSVFYRTREFGISELTKYALEIKDSCDLLVCDHAHYIDLPDGESENRAMTDLVKAIRDIALISEKPFVVVAHVRKRDSRSRSLLAELDDIMGSSNLAKVATKAVMLGPCYEPTNKPGKFFTYLRVAKNRRDGTRCRYAFVCTYDAFRNRYDDEFIIGKLTKDGTEFEPLKEADYPHWVKD